MPRYLATAPVTVDGPSGRETGGPGFLRPGETWPELIGLTFAWAKAWLTDRDYQRSGLTIVQDNPDDSSIVCGAVVDGPKSCCGYVLNRGATLTLSACSTAIATWDFEEHGFDPNTLDITGTYDSFLNYQPAGTGNCPNGTACGWTNASHRATEDLPVTAGASYVFRTDIKWHFDPAVRDVYINYDGGSSPQQMLVDGSDGYAQGSTYTVTKGFVVPAGKTSMKIWFSPYSGIMVDNMSVSTA